MTKKVKAKETPGTNKPLSFLRRHEKKKEPISS